MTPKNGHRQKPKKWLYVIPLQYPGITPRPGTTKDTVSNTGVVKRNDKIYFNVWAKMYVCV